MKNGFLLQFLQSWNYTVNYQNDSNEHQMKIMHCIL